MIVAWCCIGYLTAEHVFEISGGNCPILPLGFRICCMTFQRHLETRAAKSGILSNAISKTLLVFANFFTVNAHTQTGNGTSRPVCWHDYGQLTELEHHARCTKLSRWIMKSCHSKHSFSLRCQNQALTI